MAGIILKFPDGAEREYADATTPLAVAEAISKSLAKKVVAAKIDGQWWDLTRPLEGGGKFELVMRDSADGLEVLRHDAAHVLAQAVQELFPGTQVTFGPVTEDGFYYDFARDSVISPYVLSAIGMRAAQRYFLTAERFDATEAHRLGLVHVVVEDQNALAAEAERLTRTIFSCAPGAIGEAKALIRDVWGREIDRDLMSDTARRIARLRVGPEGREGLGAFLQKRKPSWILD